MKKSEIKVGGVYMAKVSDKVVKVRIDSVHSMGGWNATNTSTGKRIHIKTAQRLRGPAGGKTRDLAIVRPPADEATKGKKTKAKTHDAGPGNPKVTVPKDGPVDVVGYLAPGADMKAKGQTSEPASTDDAKPKKTASKKAKKTADKKPKRVSALDAAAQVLAKADKPMGAKDLIAAMAEQGLWTSPGGKTPHATLYAAIHREIAAKGDAARFKKVDRGLFEANEGATA